MKSKTKRRAARSGRRSGGGVEKRGIVSDKATTVARKTSPLAGGAEIFLLIGSCVVLAMLSYSWGMHQFGGWDQSFIVDVGWRLYSGQRPYVDFPCTLPVGFYLGAELAFRLFGVFWSSLIKINVLYFAITYFWIYGLFRVIFQRRFLPLFLALVCECTTLIRNSYWWFNSITSITAVLYFASVAAVMLRPKSRVLWCSVCLGMLLAALMKPNTSGVLIIGGTIALLLDKATRKQALIVTAISFALWMGVISIHGSTIFQVLRNYFSVGSYAFTSNRPGVPSILPTPLDWVYAALSIAGFILPLILGNRIAIKLSFAVLLAFVLMAGALAFYANGEPRLDALSLVFAASVLFASQFNSRAGNKFGGGSLKSILPLAAIGCFFVIMCLREASSRERVKSIGLGAFYESEMDPTPIQDGFFKGLYTGYNLKTSLDFIGNLTKLTDCKHIYFGNRLQWAYAAFQLPEPVGLPVWWQPGASFAEDDEESLTRKWIQAEYSPVVIMETLFLDKTFVHALQVSYTVTATEPLNPDAGKLFILTKKQ